MGVASTHVEMVDSTVIVLPGDAVHLPTPSTRLGPGTAVSGNSKDAYVSKPGILRRKGEESVWVQSQQKRYVPHEGERVLGVVTRTGRIHKIDIGTSHIASLPELAFEGATKRNKPSLQVGDLIFARLSHAHPDSEPELTCVDSSGRANGLGLLRSGGCLATCTLSLCRQLLTKSCPILQALQEHFKFELVVGFNGRVWISAPSMMQTIVIRNCIQAITCVATFQSKDSNQFIFGLTKVSFQCPHYKPGIVTQVIIFKTREIQLNLMILTEKFSE